MITNISKTYTDQNRLNLNFELALSKTQNIFMTYKFSELSNKAVVIVESEKFYKLLEKDPLKFEFDDDEKEYTSSFKNINNTFTKSYENPINLSFVNCIKSHNDLSELESTLFGFDTNELNLDDQTYININDGVQNIIYLITNGAKSFPVSCSTAEAKLLFEKAGCKRFEILFS